MSTVTVFLTDRDHPRAWRAVVSEADAITRIKTSKVVRFDLPESGMAESAEALLEQVFAITNGAGYWPKAEADYRRDGCTRSVSVGDLVELPGYGLFACEPMGWRAMTHRLTRATVEATR